MPLRLRHRAALAPLTAAAHAAALSPWSARPLGWIALALFVACAGARLA
jgi:hypothetical protein